MRKADSKSKSSVADASEQSSATTPKTIRRKRDNRGDGAPFYDNLTRIKIQRFLAACLIDAQNALASEQAMFDSMDGDPRFLNRVKYWSNVCSAIKWLGARTNTRQWHLTQFTDAELEEVSKEWQQTPES